MPKKKVAVVMSGHGRMVPWGWKMIWDRAALLTDCDITVFSYIWSTDSDNRNSASTFQHPWQFPHMDQEIFELLGSRHCVVSQGPIMNKLYRRFQAADAVPPAQGTSDEILLPREKFDRFMGQLLGFVLALDHWRDELKNYDYIVRSRWDHTIDPGVIKDLIDHQSSEARIAPLFYTKYIDFTHGCWQISGDTIYGDAAAWFDVCGNTDRSMERLIQGVAHRRQWLEQHRRPEWSQQDPLQKYFLQGWWFNTHFLWTLLFVDSNVVIKSRGESFAIHPSCSQVPLDKFQFRHAMLGPEYQKNHTNIPTNLAARLNPVDHAAKKQHQEQQVQAQQSLQQARIAALQQRMQN